MPERAFTRRQVGVNPIALELDRLAEQRALQNLGRSRGSLWGGTQDAPSPRSQDRPATDVPIATPDEIAAEEVYARALPFNYEPGDPQWGGLEEDEAYDLWANRLAETAQRYPDMTPLEREAFNRAFAIPPPYARQ